MDFENAKCLGYDSEPCPNCKRVRVEKWKLNNSVEKICEKCNWNLTKKEYEKVF